jgi:dTDP-4-dehydrorhamnose reductase
VLRTAWVFAPMGKNFVKTMLAVGATRPELRVVADQHGHPTAAPDLADAIAAVLERIQATGWQPQYRGVFHAMAMARPTGTASPRPSSRRHSPMAGRSRRSTRSRRTNIP